MIHSEVQMSLHLLSTVRPILYADAFSNPLHSPRGETETRRLVWPDQSQRQLVLVLLFHTKVRARAYASA